MDQQTTHQLEKIIALADSTHDAEAVVALRKARQMLEKTGLSFSDLARAAGRPKTSRPFSFFSGNTAHLESLVIELRQKCDDLTEALTAQTNEAEQWRKCAVSLEQKLNQSQADARRWRALAKEIAEKLWDIGQIATENRGETTPHLRVVGKN